jgi:hypothetical protein
MEKEIINLARAEIQKPINKRRKLLSPLHKVDIKDIFEKWDIPDSTHARYYKRSPTPVLEDIRLHEDKRPR